jgi:RluA family pseudouridine synthase
MLSARFASGTIILGMILSPETSRSRKARIIAPYAVTHHFKAGREFAGFTIPRMMHTRFPWRSLHEWERLMEEGRLGLKGKKVSSEYRLKADEEVFHFNPRVVEPSVPDEIRIVQEDEDYLIVYKPAPMPMHPGGRYNKNSLTGILKEMGWTELKVVHRLDAVTSGLVLFARNKTFAKEATRRFEDQKVEKSYCALVSGIPEQDKITLKSMIRRKAGYVFESGSSLENARPAETTFQVLHRGDSNAIVECLPLTGRTHQIRLHLREWGFPIADDPVYGPEGDLSSERPQNRGISLLNRLIGIPELGIHCELPLPEDWLLNL